MFRFHFSGLMIVTPVTGEFLVRFLMAYFTFGRGAPMIQRKDVVPQESRLPGGGRMAVLANHPEGSFVNLWLGMACHAILWRPGIFGSLRVSPVTVCALDLCMPAIQYEKAVMVEIMHAIKPVMAAQAGSPI